MPLTYADVEIINGGPRRANAFQEAQLDTAMMDFMPPLVRGPAYGRDLTYGDVEILSGDQRAAIFRDAQLRGATRDILPRAELTRYQEPFLRGDDMRPVRFIEVEDAPNVYFEPWMR